MFKVCFALLFFVFLIKTLSKNDNIYHPILRNEGVLFYFNMYPVLFTVEPCAKKIDIF